MRIGRHVGATSQALQLMAEIASAAAATGPTGRVCGEGCSRVCETCGSRGCQCECGPDCSDAARALSSQPSAYPIESGIVPLVYAFARTGLLHSCWSCEGHNHADGSLWKLPTVWFYCDSSIHARLLADGVAKLAAERILNVGWRVAITYSDPDNPRTTFALEPASPFSQTITLADLQLDARRIAQYLPGLIRDGGQALLKG
jgi:hypothetical protein